ncbi:MAG: hypothetical protein ACI8XM_002990, partial [Haloarculaceae archaeon]
VVRDRDVGNVDALGADLAYPSKQPASTRNPVGGDADE